MWRFGVTVFASVVVVVQNAVAYPQGFIMCNYTHTMFSPTRPICADVT